MSPRRKAPLWWPSRSATGGAIARAEALAARTQHRADGTITVSELHAAFRRCHADLHLDEVVHFMQQYDKNGDGVLDEAEFRALVICQLGRGNGTRLAV